MPSGASRGVTTCSTSCTRICAWEFSTAHCLPPLPPKSMPLEAMSRFVLSVRSQARIRTRPLAPLRIVHRSSLTDCVWFQDEDDVELSEEEFLRARLRGLQAYLNRLLSIPCVSWCKRFANFLEPDSGQMSASPAQSGPCA